MYAELEIKDLMRMSQLKLDQLDIINIQMSGIQMKFDEVCKAAPSGETSEHWRTILHDLTDSYLDIRREIFFIHSEVKKRLKLKEG